MIKVLQNRIILVMILGLLLTSLMSAQTPVLNIDGQGFRDDYPRDGAYYKDIDNILDDFEGTWISTINRSSSLTITLEKIEQNQSGPYYEDLIIGRYKYIVNGEELVNTIPNLLIDYQDQRAHDIFGNSIIDNLQPPICTDCASNEKRLRLGITEESTNVYGYMVLQRITVSGQEALKVFLIARGSADEEPSAGRYGDFTFPSGNYVFIKQ